MSPVSATPKADPSSAAFFEAKYRGDADPWHFATDPYEQDRYRTILAALSHRRYGRSLEPGCSVGVLTERLAALCDHIDALDLSPSAIAVAQTRCTHLDNVSLCCGALTPGLPFADYDLLVLSEIGYYFSAADWRELVSTLVHALAPNSTLLATHWLGRSPDHQISGDDVHTILAAHPLLRLDHTERHRRFRLDRWTRTGTPMPPGAGPA